MKPQPSFRGAWLVATVIALVAATLGVFWYKGRPRGMSRPRSEAAPVPSLDSMRPEGSGLPKMTGMGAEGYRPPSTALGPAGGPMGHGAPKGSWPGGAMLRDMDRAARCSLNLQRLVRAINMYAVDYDDHLPLARRWSDATYPYVLSQSVYRCPVAPDVPGYAFNRNLSGARTRRATNNLVVLFDSSAKTPNAADTGQSLCDPPRHPAGNNIGYLAGYVGFTGPGGLPLAWR